MIRPVNITVNPFAAGDYPVSLTLLYFKTFFLPFSYPLFIYVFFWVHSV
jgi:hypothetical protein